MNTEYILLAIRIADVTGVLANAIMGGLIARNQRFDPVGFLTLAIMSGLGGGMIRDVLLQAGPPVALTDPAYLVAAMGGAMFAFFVPVSKRLWDLGFPYLDAIALGCWSAAGTSKALGLGFDWVPSIMLGTITAVGGGALRDIVLRKVPAVFGGNTLYATPAIIASGVMVLLWPLNIEPFATLTTLFVGMLLVLLASRFEWRLPESYEWSPRRAARAMLPRSHWRRLKRRAIRRRAASSGEGGSSPLVTPDTPASPPSPNPRYDEDGA